MADKQINARFTLARQGRHFLVLFEPQGKGSWRIGVFENGKRLNQCVARLPANFTNASKVLDEAFLLGCCTLQGNDTTEYPGFELLGYAVICDECGKRHEFPNCKNAQEVKVAAISSGMMVHNGTHFCDAVCHQKKEEACPHLWPRSGPKAFICVKCGKHRDEINSSKHLQNVKPSSLGQSLIVGNRTELSGSWPISRIAW